MSIFQYFESHPLSTKIRPYVLGILALILFTANLGGLDIYITDEARNAQAAWEMLQDPGMSLPTFGGVLRTDKPPLHYWFMQLGYQFFGKTPFGARIFSALFGVLTTLLIFFFVKRHDTGYAAWWSGFCFVSSIYISIQFHLATPDPFLIFFFTLGLCLLFDGFVHSNRIRQLLGYGVLGVAILAKGPLVFFLSGLIILLTMLLERFHSWKYLMRWSPLIGFPLMVCVAAPWFIWAHFESNGAFTEGFFLNHNVRRFLQPREGHGGFFIVTILFFIITLIPFSVFIYKVVINLIPRRNTFILFIFAVVFSIVGFFMLSRTRLPSYTAIALPFASMMIGVGIDRHLMEKKKKFKRWGAYWGLATFLLALIPIVIYVALRTEYLWGEKAILTNILAIPVLGCMAGWIAYSFRIRSIGFYLLGGSCMVTAFVLLTYVYPVIDQHNHVHETISRMEKGRAVAFYDRYTPAFRFYLDDQPEYFTKYDELTTWMKKQKSKVYVVTTVMPAKTLLKRNGFREVFRQKDFFENPTTVLLEYTPR